MRSGPCSCLTWQSMGQVADQATRQLLVSNADPQMGMRRRLMFGAVLLPLRCNFRCGCSRGRTVRRRCTRRIRPGRRRSCARDATGASCPNEQAEKYQGDKSDKRPQTIFRDVAGAATGILFGSHGLSLTSTKAAQRASLHAKRVQKCSVPGLGALNG
jgi:hypothetical protein